MKHFKKEIPDDVLLVICSIIAGVLWLWTMQNSIRSHFDFYIYFGAFVVMICGPMFYSGYCKYKNNH